MAEITDEKLIKQYLKGDEKSLEILIKRYLKPIYSFVYKNIGNSEMAEDVTQETFVKVWKNLKKFDKNKSFKSWLFTIAKNNSIDFLRKKKTVSLSSLEESLPDKNNFINDIEQKDSIKKIHNVLQNLSPNYRAVILLKNESNLTFREIATSLGEPLNTIKSRYRRAIFALKNIISES